MPRVDIPVEGLSPNGNFIGTETSADDTNDHEMVNDGNTILIAINRAADTPSVTIVSVSDEYGRTGDIVQVLVATELRVFGPFKPKANWNQANGKVNIDVVGTATSVAFTALRI